MSEQVVLAKLNSKTEAVRRLGDHVEELRDAASQASTTNHNHHDPSPQNQHQHQLKSTDAMVATTGVGNNKQYQEEKTLLIQRHNREVALLRAEVEKLNCRNDTLERQAAAQRFASGDLDSNAVETNGVDFLEGEFPSRRWSTTAEGTTTSVEAPQSATKAPSRGHALTEENSNPSPSS